VQASPAWASERAWHCAEMETGCRSGQRQLARGRKQRHAATGTQEREWQQTNRMMPRRQVDRPVGYWPCAVPAVNSTMAPFSTTHTPPSLSLQQPFGRERLTMLLCVGYSTSTRSRS
jgi:hypothetical protein